MNRTDFVTALNILYAKHKETAYGKEPYTQDEAFAEGEISGISKALDLFNVTEGMPLSYADDLTETDLEYIKNHKNQ